MADSNKLSSKYGTRLFVYTTQRQEPEWNYFCGLNGTVYILLQLWISLDESYANFFRLAHLSG